MLNNQENRELVLIEDLGRLYPNENSKQKTRYGIYKCHCGVEFKAMTPLVKRNHTTSCGCYQKKRVLEASSTHGLRRHRLYKTWTCMKQRCFNKNATSYVNYGGRGITVCSEWLSDFKAFYDWAMMNGYEKHLTIDRINPYGNYEPSNCRWATNEVQSRNTRVLFKNNTSGYRGVSFKNNSNKFVSYITVNSKIIHLGTFESDLEAAKAYDGYVIDNNLEHTINGVL